MNTSSTGKGYVLFQRQISEHTGKLTEKPISYSSTDLRGTKNKMGSTDLELTEYVSHFKQLDC